MTRLLFLCTGNSCRSQMAEGWARFLGGTRVEVFSAGIEAHGVNPRAVAVMQEAGVDISAQTSNTIDALNLDAMDIVVTVCGNAEERCPLVSPGTRKIHWPLADPAKLTGTEASVMAGFRTSRDEIRRRVQALLVDFS